MIHLNLNPAPVAAGETVALTPEASIVSLGEIRVPGRGLLQVRRTTALATGRSHEYLVDSRGRGYYLDAPDRDGFRYAVSRNTGRAISRGGAPVGFLPHFVEDRIVLA